MPPGTPLKLHSSTTKLFTFNHQTLSLTKLNIISLNFLKCNTLCKWVIQLHFSNLVYFETVKTDERILGTGGSHSVLDNGLIRVVTCWIKTFPNLSLILVHGMKFKLTPPLILSLLRCSASVQERKLVGLAQQFSVNLMCSIFWVLEWFAKSIFQFICSLYSSSIWYSQQTQSPKNWLKNTKDVKHYHTST